MINSISRRNYSCDHKNSNKQTKFDNHVISDNKHKGNRTELLLQEEKEANTNNVYEVKKILSKCKCGQKSSFNNKQLNSNLNVIKNIDKENNVIKFKDESRSKIKLNKCYSLEELKVMAKDPLYKGVINLDYLSSDAGTELLNILSKFDYEKGKNLYLDNSKLNDLGVEFISFCNFKQLQRLYLYQTQITDRAIEHLIKCDFKQLQRLYLNQTQITDRANEYLIKCDFKKLQELYLYQTQITDRVKLKTKYPNCSIYYE